MTHHWPDENIEEPSKVKSEINQFLADFRRLPQRIEAGRRLHSITVNTAAAEAQATALEPDYPHLAARIRLEAESSSLLTSNALRAEAALADAATSPLASTLQRLGLASEDPVGQRLVADALLDESLRSRVVEELRATFTRSPTFSENVMNSEPNRIVEEAQQAIVRSRADWAEAEKRSLRELRTAMHSASYITRIEPIHYLISPLFRAAPETAIDLLDTMPSPLDAALCLEWCFLDIRRFEAWARAIRCAPSAWDNKGWLGRDGAQRGLALPLLLWSAEGHLWRMATNLEKKHATPDDVARAVRDRNDGAVTSWRWCAELLTAAELRERDGRSGPEDGIYRTAEALAKGNNWSDFDPGRCRDALHLEAACLLVSDPKDVSPHLTSLLPSSPEDFLDSEVGADLSSAAFDLVGALGPMFGNRPPYGLVTRILSKAFWGEEGPGRLSALWHNALILRELAAGGVTKTGYVDAVDRRNTAHPLHLIIAMGMAAVEMGSRGANVNAAGLLSEVDAMLAELRPWDELGYDALAAQRQVIATQ